MAFEPLSQTYEFLIDDFPRDWLPLIYLYDPDLPLYPLLYFHALDPGIGNHRPGERDRVFGFVHHINLEGPNLRVSVALNKDLSDPANKDYEEVVRQQCRARLGLSARVDFGQLSGSLKGQLAAANPVLKEIWYQVVEKSFGKSLPFGEMWDPVLGLVRFIASFNSEGGRKGELIQTHYFAQAFGKQVATGGSIHADFYLLPTFQELTDKSNPLSDFGRFAHLVTASKLFCDKYCPTTVPVAHPAGSIKFSVFNRELFNIDGKFLDNQTMLAVMNAENGKGKEALFENHSAFNRGAHRSVIALMMVHDLRKEYWHPDKFTPEVCADLYTVLKRAGSWQAPKVIQLYAQQCFGVHSVLPIDTWTEAFLKWPLGFNVKRYWDRELFKCSDVWGKIERLIWLAAQARKVHSSVCAEILWCIRFGSPGEEDRDAKLRGANPMACKICADHIRAVCPAFDKIRNAHVSFNGNGVASFNIKTSAKDNTSSGQLLVSCTGPGTVDEYSSRDKPDRFQNFPRAPHKGEPITVEDFIQRY